MPEISSLISSLGFPIAVCLWFMFRLEAVIKNNTEALIEVKQLLEVMNNK